MKTTLILGLTLRVVVWHVKYKLSYNVIKTQDDLKKIYPFIIEDIKKMKFVTAIASYRHGYNYRNENEALVVFRKVYTDYTRYGKIHNPKSQSVRGYDGVFPTLRWVLSAWLRRLYLVSGMLVQ